MRWSESITIEFVKIYLKHECLWNPSHPGYKLKHKREKAYFEIVTEFKSTRNISLTVPEVKIKIKNLRSTYGQQVTKILQKSNPDCIYEPSLVWFHEMDRCLKNIYGYKLSESNVNKAYPQEIQEIDSSTQIWNDNEEQSNNIEALSPDPLIQQTDDQTDEYDLNGQDTTTTKIEKSPLLQRYYKKSKKKKFKRKIPLKDYSTDSSTETMTKDDEFDIYGKFIASQLRNMNLQKALRLQLEIQNLISEARLSDLPSE